MGFADYMDNGNYVSYPLVVITGTPGIINPFNAAVYANDAEAQAAAGGHTIKTFASLADYQAALALNGGDVLKLFGLGGRTPAAVGSGTGGNAGTIVTLPGVDAGFLGGILDGDIMGIPKKYLLIGAAAYYFLSK